MNPKRSFINRLLGIKTAEAPEMLNYNVRGQNVNDNDLKTMRAIMFGELSNNKSKQDIEARQIFNTALNRMPQYQAKGKNYSLHDVVTRPNQYQAYGSNEYKKYLQGKLNVLDQRKLGVIDNVIRDSISGNFVDNTGGRVNYIHDKKGNLLLKEGNLYK